MKLNTLFIGWLHQRKISDTIIEKFGLHTLNERLVIPIKDFDGTFLFNKYRRSPLDENGPKYTYDRGGKLALYGAKEALNERRVLFVEGEADALVAWSHNIPAVSGTGGAMSIDKEWASFFADKEVIICFDNDPAGGEGMVKALEVAPHAKILFIPDKPNVKDISDYVAHGGNLHTLLGSAKHFSGIEDVRADMAERSSQWQSVHFHSAYIKHHTKPIRVSRAVPDARLGDLLTRAKQFPITELVEFNSRGSTRCLWHSETEASLHYYPKQNKCWCFGGCGRGFDAIDVYQKLHGCGFKEAVNKLQ